MSTNPKSSRGKRPTQVLAQGEPGAPMSDALRLREVVTEDAPGLPLRNATQRSSLDPFLPAEDFDDRGPFASSDL